MEDNQNKFGTCEYHEGEREMSYCDPKLHPNCDSNGEMLCEICCNEGKFHAHFGFRDISEVCGELNKEWRNFIAQVRNVNH